MFQRSALSLLLLVAAAGLASAQPAVGPEFRVNSYTTYDQTGSSVGVDANGNFVVVWASRYQDGEYFDVFGQRFDRFGGRQGAEFRVNAFTSSYQVEGRIAVHPAGQFVVTWTSGADQDGDLFGVMARRYDAAGNPLGPEFVVNTHTPDYQYSPDIAPTTNGGFVVVWSSYAQEGPGLGVFGQVFDAAGARVGAEFQINTYTTGHQLRPRVAPGPAGSFVVVWASYPDDGIGQDGDLAGIFGQRFNATGGRVGGEFRVNSYTPYWQEYPAVASDALGNFVVVWNSEQQDGSDYGIFGQRFDAAGGPAGPEFQINTYTFNAQRRPSVAREADGHFVVTWRGRNQVNSAAAGDEIFGQRFDPAGAKVGPEFRVNSYTPDAQIDSAVASAGPEKFVVTWTSPGQDGYDNGIFGQRFGDLITRDGFESGDFSRWSSAATDGGDLSITPSAALNGSTLGMSAFADDTNGLFVQDDTPNDERFYRARFYFDPNDFDPGETLLHRRTRLLIAFDTPTRRVMALVLRRLNGQYALRGRARRDDDTQADTAFAPITAVPHLVELRWERATAPGANNGLLEVWVDDILVASVVGVDNDAANVDFIRLGGLSVKAGASGTMYFDGFESRRETHIGP